MFTRHRLGPTNKLDCPHAMGTNAFSPQWPKSFRYIRLLPPPSLVYNRRKPTNLRISFRASASQLQTSRLRLRSHAGARASAGERTGTVQPGGCSADAQAGELRQGCMIVPEAKPSGRSDITISMYLASASEWKSCAICGVPGAPGFGTLG